MANEDDISRRSAAVPGDPTSAVPPEPPAPEGAPKSSGPRPRVGTELLGIPDDGPSSSEEVCAAESLFEREEPLTDEEFDEALLDATRGVDLLGPVRKRLGVWPVLVFLSSAIILFLLSQVLTLTNHLQSLPGALRIGGFALLALLIGGILWALWRLMMVFAKARTTPRIYVEALRKLSARVELRQLANARLHQAKSALREFLTEYPLDERSKAVALLGKCLKDVDLQTLKANAHALLSEDYATSEGWLEQFDRQFLDYLDRAARHRIGRYAKLVGLKTAALPSGLDTPVVLLNAYLLAADLCIIYNLRTTGTGTAAILLRVFFNAFAASQASEWTESAANLLFEGGGMLAGAGKAFAARAAEGGTNYFLFRRLGAAMVRYLRPIWPPHR